MLTWNAVSHDFGAGPVLADVTLRVGAGEALTLAGRSGCGKTSLLHMAAGLLEPSSGRTENRFSRTACVFQDPRLLPWRRALDNIAFGLKALGMDKEARHEEARALAGRMGLSPRDLTKFPHQLSGGMRQRVSLARALAVKPDLLLLDEPFSALDVGLRRELQDLVLARIAEEGLAAVFVTHDLAEAVRVSHSIVVLAPGPGRVVHKQTIKEPLAARDGAFIRQLAAALLAAPAVDAALRNGGPASSPPPKPMALPAQRQEVKMKNFKPVQLPETKLATDMAGRKTLVGTQVGKVFGYNPMVTALIFTLAPEKIGGLGMPPMPPEHMLADEAYLSLPVLGVMGGDFGGGKATFDKEAVRRHGIDLVLSMTLFSLDETEVRAADALQRELNIPVLIYDGSVERTGEVLRRVGELIGVPDRGKELAAYFDEKFYAIQDTLARIPRDERRTVYYAQSPTGLLTEPRKSRHGEIIDFAGGINVAEVHEQRGCGKTPVSADDLARWNPDVIIMLSDEGKSPQRLRMRAATDPFWSSLGAVKSGSVYEPPGGMYNWFDRPPSVNRLMGLIWLSNLLYPEWFGWDLVEEAREFYRIFYRIELGPKQVETLVGAAMPRAAN